MANFLEYLAPVAEAVKDNQYGLIAAAIFVIALAVITISKGGTAWIRIIGMILVAASSVGMSMAVLYQNDEMAATGLNGSPCLGHSDCRDGNCYPGPHAQAGGSTKKYCLAADHNCALPGFDGAKYGTEIFSNGTKLTCNNPGGSTSSQFYRSQ